MTVLLLFARLLFEFLRPGPDDRSDRMKKARFRIDLIFGTAKAYIFDNKIGGTLILDLPELLTEENYEEHFNDLVKALIQSGRARESDAVDCFTYPEGSTMHFPEGTA